jgi:hypothetical protein
MYSARATPAVAIRCSVRLGCAGRIGGRRRESAQSWSDVRETVGTGSWLSGEREFRVYSRIGKNVYMALSGNHFAGRILVADRHLFEGHILVAGAASHALFMPQLLSRSFCVFPLPLRGTTR